MNQPDLTSAPLGGAAEIETVADRIAAVAREFSSEIDNDRRLPEELVALLVESGLLRAGAPGLEAVPLDGAGGAGAGGGGGGPLAKGPPAGAGGVTSQASGAPVVWSTMSDGSPAQYFPLFPETWMQVR